MVTFAMQEHWNFTQATFLIARSISKVKILRKNFALFSECLAQAKSLMFEESMGETDILISQGRLDGLSIETIEGINQSIHYTTGRFGSSTTEKLYGVERLPVIHNSTRLALLILREAHAGDDNSSHRMSPSDIIGRGRKYAYIYKPYNLATVVVQTCP